MDAETRLMAKNWHATLVVGFGTKTPMSFDTASGHPAACAIGQAHRPPGAPCPGRGHAVTRPGQQAAADPFSELMTEFMASADRTVMPARLAQLGLATAG